VSWLREAEAHPPGTVASKSLLNRALSFWERVYDDSLEATSGRKTAGWRFLYMERAVLGLWLQPGAAIAALYRLHHSPLREDIARHLNALAPAGPGGAGLIQLPWFWSERTPRERAMLRVLGLGGDLPPVSLRRSGRAWLGIGLLVGMGLVVGKAALERHSSEFPEIGATVSLSADCRNDEMEENGFTFVRICPGTFTMGSQEGDPKAYEDEMPAHRATLGEFWLSKFEVTNAQYRQLRPGHKWEGGNRRLRGAT